MTDGLLSILERRFAAAAEALPKALPAIDSDEPVAFLLRYRRDALAGLPDATFRKARAIAREEHDLERRRAAARKTAEKAGRLTEEFAAAIAASRDAAWLEDLHRPARRGGEVEDPMTEVARKIAAGEAPEPIEDLLRPFCGADGAHPTAADQRARLVGLLANLLGDDADRRAAVRAEVRRHGVVTTEVAAEHRASESWKSFAELKAPIGDIRPRDLLQMRRGQKLGALRVRTEIPEERSAELLAGPLAVPAERPHADLLAEAAKEALQRILVPAAASVILADRRRQATRSLLPRMQQALHERLTAPPAGAVPVIAVAPGTQGSCRILAVDAQGRPGQNLAVHPFPPQNEKEASAKTLADLLRETGAKIVAVASSRRARGPRTFAEDALAQCRELGASPVFISEAAAAQWAEGEEAKAEAPELAASARTALSIGRFVQDPVREASRWDLTEIPLDPAQRDLDQGELRTALEEVLEDCVADIGVDVNAAPIALLSRVPGLGITGARALVAARERHGTFPSRAKIREAEGLTEQQWQRAAGFLRVRDAVDPLDATGVHPTGMDIVAAIAAAKGVEPSALVGARELLDGLDPAQFSGPVHTASDVESVLHELRVGREDPRTAFVAPAFNPGVQRIRDLEPGMEVEGVVASVSAFGAFVDVGVRQHGLVHVSEMSHEYVKDPSQVVAPGQKVRVKVLGVDSAKRRISLSMKALLPAPVRPPREEMPPREPRGDGFGGGPREGRFQRAHAEGGGGPGSPGGPGGTGFGGPRGGGDRGPRGPRRGEGGPRGPGGPGGRDRGTREDHGAVVVGPGGMRFEKPGTAPRRAMNRGRKQGPDRRRDDEMSLARDRDKRGARPAEAVAESQAAAARAKPAARGVDPFQAQLDALAAQMGMASRRPAQAAQPQAPAADEEGPKNRKERRALLLAQRAREAAEAAASGAAAPQDAGAAVADALPDAGAESPSSEAERSGLTDETPAEHPLREPVPASADDPAAPSAEPADAQGRPSE